MTTVVDGRQLATQHRAKVREQVLELDGGPPRLVAVLVGEDPASQIYVRNKQRAAGKAGIDSESIQLPADTDPAELLDRIAALNQDPGTHGILVQLPLPPQIDPGAVAAAVHPDKDVDCLNPANSGLLVRNQARLRPCTPSGCLHILDAHGVEIEGARAVIVGRSEIVGKPLALMLLHRHATVTLCHSRTRDLAGVAREADILVAAVGVPELVQGDWVRPGAAVIDVGMNRLEGGLVGDVAFEPASERAGLITPVPGGVGPLTIAMLIENTLEAFRLQRGANAA
ncbi:MAG: bifunctional 5,10-methylenetetrahydrofolate dehydrogenase/5,10-methenyltetrahydrofolate cyclohydrolase [Proteobacteria bacterium]|nr:bifunctional 5,10-methylenetetrahydrofolate dehydrogenase/5,10-methenyltetrahydrofolate cyclohydrolase [Pseudomonadota bacterium]